MAKTSYRDCWWLIQAVNGEFGDGSYRNHTGYSIKDLIGCRPTGKQFQWIPANEIDEDDSEDQEFLRRKDSFRKLLMRLRTIIYNEFGLAIMMDSTSGQDKHGNGGYYYYLVNPELLEEDGKTLRDHIEFLAKSETKRDEWVSLEKMTNYYSGKSSSMGFMLGCVTSSGYLSDTNTSPRKTLGQENLALVQFAMKFGEVLTIKFGKVRTDIDIDAPYSFEPYQVKETEGRWYAIGNLYPLGHKESAELAVYDLDKMELAYNDENPDVAFEPTESFDYIEKLFSMSEYLHVKNIQKVIQVILTTSDDALARNLRYNPLCSAQEEIGKGQFRVFIRPSVDFLLQLCTYGDELKVDWTNKDDKDIRLLNDILNRVRSVRNDEVKA